MTYKKPEIPSERYYSVNSDWTGERTVSDGHEIVEYPAKSLHRIWLNEQPGGYEAHWHSAMEIILPIENTYTVICGSDKNDKFVIKPEEILIIPPGVIHEILPTPSGSRFIFLMNVSSTTKLKGSARIMSILSRPLLINNENSPEVYSDIYNILLQMRNEYFGNSEFSELSIQALLLKLFITIGENYAQQESVFSNATPTKRREYVDLFNETLEYIDNHFTEELSLGDIAANTGFSKFHFSRLFKQYTNYNFSDYLCFRRIKEAETLLARPDVSITDVAISSGFSSISTFNRLFKQQKGCSPSEYRRQNSSMKKAERTQQQQ